MTPKLLVAYATKYGSTQEVAEAIAAVLREHGLAVECTPMRDVQSLADYGAVVLGAPIFIGAWHNDARDFLARHRDALIERPPAVFALGPLHRNAEELRRSRGEFDHLLAKFPWLHPIALEVFVGKYDAERLRFPDSLAARLPVSPLFRAASCDERDWTAIREWASSLVALVQPAVAA